MRRKPSFASLYRRGLVIVAMLHAMAAGALAPSVTLINPPTNTLLSVGDTIQLQASATDADGIVTKVEWYVNGAFQGEDAVDPFGVEWTARGEGDYQVAAVAIDDALERSTSAVVNVTVGPPMAHTLTWVPRSPADSNWNGSAISWRINSSGQSTVFHAGDMVNFPGAGGPFRAVFIGAEGSPMAVAPAAVRLQGFNTFIGGDILTGSLAVFGMATFSNYSGSLSFPGGTTNQSGSAGILTYDVSGAPNGASVHFGTGPVTLNYGSFAFQMTSNRFVTLENDFVVGLQGGWIRVNPAKRWNAVARFSGTLSLGGPIELYLFSGNTAGYGGGDNAPHEWTGPVVLFQSGALPPWNPRLNVMGDFSSKGLLIAGPISDGAGDGTNRLHIASYAVPFIRLTGANTYARGTLIESSAGSPRAVIEVGPESSLGGGDVEVAYGGVLRLMGNRTIASNASVIVRGQVILDGGVKVRVSSLQLGDTVHTSGLFTATNRASYLLLVSNGTFRLPATNLLPTVALTHPLQGASFTAGDTITMQAAVSDVDSYIAQVEFRVNGMLFAVCTNAPFQVSLRNAPAGSYPLQAVAYDDDGGMSTSAAVAVGVAPRIDRIESVGADRVALEFNSLIGQSCILQATDTCSPPAWTNLTVFPGDLMPHRLRVTNALPAGVNARFYRLLVP